MYVIEPARCLALRSRGAYACMEHIKMHTRINTLLCYAMMYTGDNSSIATKSEFDENRLDLNITHIPLIVLDHTEIRKALHPCGMAAK